MKKLLILWFQKQVFNFYDLIIKHSYRFKYKMLIKRNLLSIGKYTYGRPVIDVYKGSEAKVIIGNFCSISKNSTFITGGVHSSSWVSTFPFRIYFNLAEAYKDGMPATDGDIIVGSDVFIGTDAMILSGVKIGHGAVVAARAVVTADIPPYAIAAGVPAKVIRFRFKDEIIKRLLEIRWWEWDDVKIIGAIPLLSSSNIDDFLLKYG